MPHQLWANHRRDILHRWGGWPVPSYTPSGPQFPLEAMTGRGAHGGAHEKETHLPKAQYDSAQSFPITIM